MYFVTTKKQVRYHQMSLDELFDDSYHPRTIKSDPTSTYTYMSEQLPVRLDKPEIAEYFTQKLREFNHNTAFLRERDRESLYDSFSIPKKSGGLRQIDAPCPELKDQLTGLKLTFERDFHVLCHTTAFAYVHGRCTVDAVKKHQQNESRWFAKLDLHNFFGSTTLDFVMQQLSMVYPFCIIVKTEEGKQELRKAVEMGFLRGGLPQGTPLSPTLTNIMMVPIDHILSKKLRERFPKSKFVYTRYADDFLISSRFPFKIRDIEQVVIETLREFNAPFQLNQEKTRYGSNQGSGANWNLGVMLNKDNAITVGHKNKQRFQAILYNFMRDYRQDIRWPLEDIQHVLGLYSYYRMVEGDTIDRIVSFTNAKFNMDSIGIMRSLTRF